MKTIAYSVLVLGLFGLAGRTPFPAAGSAKDKENKADDKAKKPRGKFTIGKETTFVTGPVDKDRYIDYAAALNKHWRRGVTAANNANVLIWQALGPRPEGGRPMSAEFFQWMGIKPLPEVGPYFVDLLPYVKQEFGINPQQGANALFKQLDQAQGAPWKAKDYPELASWLKANDKPLAVIVAASRRPHYFSPLVPPKTKQGSSGLIGALLPAVQKTRSAASALIARAMLRLGEGKRDAAWDDLLACHRLGRLVGRGPTLIEGLVGLALNAIAIQAEQVYLGRGRPGARRLQACLEDLRKLPPLPPMAKKVAWGERMMFLDIVTLTDRQGAKYLKGVLAGMDLAKVPQPFSDRILKDIDWDAALRNANRWYDRLAAALAEKNRVAREKNLDQIERDLKALKQHLEDGGLAPLFERGKKTGKARGKVLGDLLIALLMPAVRKVQSAVDRVRQTEDNLLVAIALARYERANNRYPKDLDALVPKYLGQIPQDAFSGKALIYHPTNNGYLLYSVGVNGKDEWGRGYNDKPPGDDLSVRMPVPGK
jgi:hypothetical protein